MGVDHSPSLILRYIQYLPGNQMIPVLIGRGYFQLTTSGRRPTQNVFDDGRVCEYFIIFHRVSLGVKHVNSPINKPVVQLGGMVSRKVIYDDTLVSFSNGIFQSHQVFRSLIWDPSFRVLKGFTPKLENHQFHYGCKHHEFRV